MNDSIPHHCRLTQPLRERVATVLHGRRDIEAILREIGPALLMEIGAAEIQTLEEGRNQ